MKTAPWYVARTAWSSGLGVALSLGAVAPVHAQAHVTIGFADGPTFSSNTPHFSWTNPSPRPTWAAERV